MALPDPRKVASGAGLLAGTVGLMAWDRASGRNCGALILVALSCGLGWVEFARMARAGGRAPATVMGGLAVAGLLVASYWSWDAFAWAAALAFPAIFAVFLARKPGPDALADMGVTVVGLVYLGVLGAFVIRLVETPVVGPAIFIWTVLVTKITDIGAYVGGRAMGRHKMAPAISPGKTWEGAASGVVAGVASGCMIASVLGLAMATWPVVVAGGILVAVVGQVGDLAESLIKRCLAVKDSSALIPAYGGVLDVIDSLLFTVPLAYAGMCISQAM